MNSTFSDLLNKVHLGAVPTFLDSFPDDCVGLTLTSPPYYDSELYVLDGDVLEFGWRTYEDYLSHLKSVLTQLLRVTIPGGRLVLVLSNTPETDDDGFASNYWPLNHDVSGIARDVGWIMVDEVIWVKTDKVNYDYLKSREVPESSTLPKHDTVSVFRKPGPKRPGHDRIKHSSVWQLELAGPVKKYNKMYPSFPDELVERSLRLWSLEGDIVLDPYAGSGQVCRVAKELNRYFVGVEIDKQWVSLWKDINER